MLSSVNSKIDYTISAKPLDAELFAHDSRIESINSKDKYWTAAEERRLVLKIDLSILVFLMFSFFSLQLDRGNVSNAITGGLGKSLHLTTNKLSTGNQLQSAAIVVTEIPSNILIQKIGCLPLLLIQSSCWGLVAIFQSFVKTKSSYYATRWLLGMFEAGFIPGSIYFISKFYKRNEISTRTTIFYFGNYFASAVSNLIAAGILGMPKTSNWEPWRYLFMIEGCITVFATILLFIFVARSPENPSPIHGMFCLFTEREKKIMLDRLCYNSETTISDNFEKEPITFTRVIKAIFHWRNWLHCMMNFLQITPYGGLQLFSPKIIKSLGFSTVRANALASIGPFGLCFFSLTMSLVSDYFQIRGPFILICLIYSVVFSGVLKSMHVGKTNKWTLFAMITMINAGTGSPQSLNNSWLALNSKVEMERAIGLSMCVIGANLGGIAGQNLFKDRDAPVYSPAFTAIVCFYGVSIAWCCGIIFIYLAVNKRRCHNASKTITHKTDVQQEEDISSKWKYQF